MRVIKALLKATLFVVVLYVAVDIGVFTAAYHNHWLKEFRKFQSTYSSQQMTVTLIRSQRRWEDQAEFNLQQLKFAHQDLVIAERQLKHTQFEYYHFLRTLETVDSEALKETLDRIKKPKLIIPFFNIPLKPEQAECEDGTCEENSSS